MSPWMSHKFSITHHSNSSGRRPKMDIPFCMCTLGAPCSTRAGRNDCHKNTVSPPPPGRCRWPGLDDIQNCTHTHPLDCKCTHKFDNHLNSGRCLVALQKWRRQCNNNNFAEAIQRDKKQWINFTTSWKSWAGLDTCIDAPQQPNYNNTDYTWHHRHRRLGLQWTSASVVFPQKFFLVRESTHLYIHTHP